MSRNQSLYFDFFHLLNFILIILFFSQPDSIHIDLRAMSQVYFDPPSKVRVGAGAVWKQVLDVVDPKLFTMIHGNVSLV